MLIDVLDLFQPENIVGAIQYQATAAEADWEQRHIKGMLILCEYVRDTYPGHYKQVERIHKQFLTKEADI